MDGGAFSLFLSRGKPSALFPRLLECFGVFRLSVRAPFWITSPTIKQLLELPPERQRFSDRELKERFERLGSLSPEEGQRLAKRDRRFAQEWTALLRKLKEFEQVNGPLLSMEQAMRERILDWQRRGKSSEEIARLFGHEASLSQRLKGASPLFKALPSRLERGEWLPLKALHVQVYDPSSNDLIFPSNFTLFSDADFTGIRQAYLEWEKAIRDPGHLEKRQQREEELFTRLHHAYQSLAGQLFQQAHDKQLFYPTERQLSVETLYVSYPWILFLIALYGLSVGLFLFAGLFSWIRGLLSVAFLFHTAHLVARAYILWRPPVSNMAETVMYVPWVAIAMSLLVPSFRRQPLVLLAASLTCFLLLSLLEITHLNPSLEQVQAVLDSQLWLTIHVLLVVGSYGVFILGAILGHFYLLYFLKNRGETVLTARLGHLILQMLYVGTLLLTVGTILGGVWAAESWGRFWDWDPKESWAFISIALYLILIHAYRFHQIGFFGLAVGAVSGLLAISFTWYGVNYLLGTGLHSYGFGRGGEGYYFLFFGGESLFLLLTFLFSRYSRRLSTD